MQWRKLSKPAASHKKWKNENRKPHGIKNEIARTEKPRSSKQTK